MRILCTLFLTFYVILNSIEISSCIPPKTRDFLSNFGMSNEHANHEELSSEFEHLPNDAAIPGVSRGGPSSSSFDTQHSPANYHLPARHSPLRSPRAEPSQRARSQSPHTRYIGPATSLPSADGNGYERGQLQFILLTSIKNVQRKFVLRKYTFPAHEPIKVLIGNKVYRPVPPIEQIVLSTFDGDVFAIVSSRDTLAGIYRHIPQIKANKRIKINMESDMITPLSTNETEEVPVGPLRPMSHSFRIEHVNYSSGPDSLLGPSTLAAPLQHVRSQSPPARSTASPTRLPSSDGNGYGLDQLPFIRLIPIKNLNRQFELRKYTFPANGRFKVLTENKIFKPVTPEEQIVLSTSDGDVFAILLSRDILAGIYKHFGASLANKRTKINMESGTVSRLTPYETEEIPVGPHRPISHNFRIERVIPSNISPSHAEPGSSASSTIRPALPFSHVLGYRLDQLQFLRLFYRENPLRIFEFRKYTFPADKPIKILAGQNDYRPMPFHEQIVLSTCGGDVFAILESNNVFGGIYARNPRTFRDGRAKMNMESEIITSLTPDEIRETPVGPRHQNFIVKLVNQNPPHH